MMVSKLENKNVTPSSEIPLVNADTTKTIRVGLVLQLSLFLDKRRSNPETNKNIDAVGFMPLHCMRQLN